MDSNINIGYNIEYLTRIYPIYRVFNIILLPSGLTTCCSVRFLYSEYNVHHSYILKFQLVELDSQIFHAIDI
jgi:hypothetical protein